MKRFGIMTLVLALVVSMFAAAFAEPVQVASAFVQADFEGERLVKLTVDLADNWSAEFKASTAYLYDHAFDPTFPGAQNYEAFVSFCTREDYDETLADWAEEGTEYQEKDGYAFAPYFEDMTLYIRPVDEEICMEVFIFNTTDADNVLARIVSCDRADSDKN